MALQTSGQISLNDMHIEVGGTSGSQVSLNDTDIRDLIGKASGAQSSFSEFYGAAAETEVSSEATINGQSNYKELLASDLVSAGGTLVIPSGFWVWSDSTSTAALTIDVSCTVKNYGKIIGRGGDGFNYNEAGSSNGVGGPAIKINSGVTGVSITNYSGAYIAGGGGAGGAGGGAAGPRGVRYPAGGGGAGGGKGGRGYNGPFTGVGYSGNVRNGGSLNAAGEDQNSSVYSGGTRAKGGGAGGGGGGGFQHYDESTGSAAGGRILPGTGGAGDLVANLSGLGGHADGGTGGSAGNVGGQPESSNASGGGGGWGANGAQVLSSASYSAGGAAISSPVSYTLSNSGTIYGST